VPVKRHKVKSCCGSSTYIFEIDKPIKKYQLQVFKDAGCSSPKNFVSVGVFYVRFGGLIATTSFGSKRVSIRCTGNDCDQLMNRFEKILDEAVNS
jgi:hypothetical protein